jgi:aspartyl-tRNA(Asn)/glutamyl-tRNA(Gln) amidotransferase subunit B
VLNARAVELATRAALALDCEIQPRSVFARKNYFYPDLPKGYQISQYESPLAKGGRVPIEVDGEERVIGLTRLHLEEDAGKLLHEGLPDSEQFSHVDLNRAGTPLVEIVTQPELRNAKEARALLERLRALLRIAGVCDGNMEEGSLRCDANVSIRRRGDQALGVRTELKNLNSFRNMQRAIDHEIARQTGRVLSGRTVEQATLLWDADAGATRVLRTKEDAEDYRYFPEPDLPPITLRSEWIARRREELPELPHIRKRRLVASFGLSPVEADQLSLEPALADYFEAVAVLTRQPRQAANFVLNDVRREQHAEGRDPADIPLRASALAELIELVDTGVVSITAARRELFGAMWRSGGGAADLARELGLEQMSDVSVLREVVRQVVACHPEQVAQYRAGKAGLLGFLVGRAMRAAEGRGNPQQLSELMREALE